MRKTSINRYFPQEVIYRLVRLTAPRSTLIPFPEERGDFILVSKDERNLRKAMVGASLAFPFPITLEAIPEMSRKQQQPARPKPGRNTDQPLEVKLDKTGVADLEHHSTPPLLV